MKFHSQYCPECKGNKLFLEKLTNPSDPDCIDMEDVCQTCKTQFKVKVKTKIKVKL
ncbi:hypothetical protein M1M24_gp08 [Polaribacter phage Freya_1]|uniref:Uncharacterized protein n=2 Tax=Freyavirus TaxID=2948713 RepID=A0A8E5EB48_9CAUD|nr:hypothetical protein M1M23_gp74 [Polaribacter phage Danklef_1]YP_010356697.1 hypothetical protein M1M24_gp08 [Polaribacter phage Freya_1]QQV90634.1 hypothetical protein Danklef2_73 [Polaribacter phage Danklef_2]QQV90711.1 hypothetical protein Danklef3_74 [Polaribacter phage Danklef_3]QQV90788.1 hypothetical protein Danklef4_74 [Polaribacter phage Danklef_4]QQV90866.1 hypothetical protein Danklef5_75 [Polaribacter phage Danklef_5]QQV90945.1 hypothetical protein Freya2_8 [Polaribacter phage 